MPKGMEEREVKTAILSVADKTGLADFAKGIERFGVSLLATGGTLSLLKGAGTKAWSLQEAMGLSEALSGRVKTLHSGLFAGILAKRTEEHLAELRSRLLAGTYRPGPYVHFYIKDPKRRKIRRMAGSL